MITDAPLVMGPVRGGLAIGTVIICAIFAAMSGISAERPRFPWGSSPFRGYAEGGVR